MTNYRCPVCGVADLHAYLRCYHPGCTDGRDSGVRRDAVKQDATDRMSDTLKAMAVRDWEAVKRDAEAALQSKNIKVANAI